MKKILVTGGTGTLGRYVVNQLLEKNYLVSVLTSQQHPSLPKGVNIFVGDLATNTGLHEAIANAEVIIHCASNPRDFQKTVIEGSANLLKTIDRNKTQHFVYISIVGVDKSSYPYYEAKNKVEKMIAGSGISYSILRATQFHNFVFNIIKPAVDNSTNGVVEVPQGMRFQPIDIREVATHLVNLVKDGPSGLLPDAGGPQVHTIEEMAQAYLDNFKARIEVQPVPVKNERSDVFRSGINLCPQNVYGQITWKDFLREQFKVAAN